LAGCDPYPIAELKNETPAPIAVEFMFPPARAGDPASTVRYEVQAGRSIRFPSGELFAPRIVMTSGGCSYAFNPTQDSNRAIDGDYGAVTKLAITPDLRLLVRGWAGDLGVDHRRNAISRPAGWPLSPQSKACR
jgi:hypothetical protein